MKSHEILIQYLQSKAEINDRIVNDVLEQFIPLNKKKNELLVGKGEVCRYLYFLVNGVVRNYFVDYNGKEFSRLITYKNKFFTNFLSFQKQIPSNEKIECIEDAELLKITKVNFDSLINNHSELFKIFTFEVIEYHNFHLEKLEFLSLLTPKEKLEYLWNNEKELIKRVSNGVLASYMGVKQETCSRLKKEIFK